MKQHSNSPKLYKTKKSRAKSKVPNPNPSSKAEQLVFAELKERKTCVELGRMLKVTAQGPTVKEAQAPSEHKNCHRSSLMLVIKA